MKESYYNNRESVKEYIELAKDVSGKELIESLKAVLPDHSDVLEIGSGPGTDYTILRRCFKVTGSDNSPEFLKHLTAKYPNGEFLHLDAITLQTHKIFDGIYSNKVLHHLKDEELSLSVKRQYEILNPNGIICHSFWKGEGSEIFKGLFVNYHTKENLMSFFKPYFQILSLETYDEFDDKDSLLLIGKKL